MLHYHIGKIDNAVKEETLENVHPVELVVSLVIFYH